ncbi:hypothetical protein RHSIM_Rhsim12G0012400 [Rhododendron simsii]|uniref:Uncharacterized protein n=1 Tax=Rhododendron simsii TaxID=118357 RepID=A0A834G5H0_RHOSS|nr:hypothetical protein RHSIM_Rhsim12G0012400 [Rhododendron simsii]
MQDRLFLLSILRIVMFLNGNVLQLRFGNSIVMWLFTCRLSTFAAFGIIYGSVFNRACRGGTGTSNAVSFHTHSFVDYSLVFLEADISNCHKIKEILSKVGLVSRDTVIFQKSEIMFSPNLEGDLKESI